MCIRDSYSLKLIAALRRYTVDDSEQKAQHAFQFITGSSLMIFANNGRLNTLSNDKYRSDDYPALYEDGMEFMIGGTVRLLRGAWAGLLAWNSTFSDGPTWAQ